MLPRGGWFRLFFSSTAKHNADCQLHISLFWYSLNLLQRLRLTFALPLLATVRHYATCQPQISLIGYSSNLRKSLFYVGFFLYTYKIDTDWFDSELNIVALIGASILQFCTLFAAICTHESSFVLRLWILQHLGQRSKLQKCIALKSYFWMYFLFIHTHDCFFSREKEIFHLLFHSAYNARFTLLSVYGFL